MAGTMAKIAVRLTAPVQRDFRGGKIWANGRPGIFGKIAWGDYDLDFGDPFLPPGRLARPVWKRRAPSPTFIF
jgi:hypothetical protein